MTIVAWDGRTLATDKMSSSAGYGYKMTKIYRLKDGSLVAFAGSGNEAMALLHWLNGDRLSTTYPKTQEENGTCAFVVRPDGLKASYGKTPYPETIEDELYAMGHGRDFALAATHCGRTALEAVELTCRLDLYCGCGIDVLELR